VQVKLLSRVDLMIAMAGSDVMNAIFMRPHSRLFIVGRIEGYTCGLQNINCGNEFDLWFQHWGQRTKCFTDLKYFQPDQYSCTNNGNYAADSILNLTPDMFDADIDSMICDGAAMNMAA